MRKPRALACSLGVGVERAGVAHVSQHEEQDGDRVEGCQDEPVAVDDLLAPQQVEHDGVDRRQQDGQEQPAHGAHALAFRLGVELLQLAVECLQPVVAEAGHAEHLYAVEHGTHRVRPLARSDQDSRCDQQPRGQDEPGGLGPERTGREAADVEEVDGVDRQRACRPDCLERARQSLRSIYII